MVRFTLKDNRLDLSMRVDVPGNERMTEISCMASDCWGSNGFIMTNRHMVVESSNKVSECVSEGDVVELIPDPSDVPELT